MVRFCLSTLNSRLRKKFGEGYMIFQQIGRRREIKAIFFVHQMVFAQANMIGLKAAVYNQRSGSYELDLDDVATLIDLVDLKENANQLAYSHARTFLQFIEEELQAAGEDYEIDNTFEMSE